MSDFVLSCSVTRSKRAGQSPGSATSLDELKNRRNLLKQRLSRRFLTRSGSEGRSCDSGQTYQHWGHGSGSDNDGEKAGVYYAGSMSRSSSCRLDLSSCSVSKSDVDRLRDEVRRKSKPRSRSMRAIGNTDSCWHARLDGLSDGESGGDGDGGNGGAGRSFKHIWSYYKSIWSLSSDSDSDLEDVACEALDSHGKEKTEVRDFGDVNGYSTTIASCKEEGLGNKSVCGSVDVLGSNIVQPVSCLNDGFAQDSVEDIIHSVEEMTRSALSSIEDFDGCGCVSSFDKHFVNSNPGTDVSMASPPISPNAASLHRHSNHKNSPSNIRTSQKLDRFDIKTSDHGSVDDAAVKTGCEINSVLKDSSLHAKNTHYNISAHQSVLLSGDVLTDQERACYPKPRLNSFGEDGISSDFGSSMEFLDSSNSEIGYCLDPDGRSGVNKKLVSDDSDLGSSKDDLDSDSNSEALSEDFLTVKCATCDENDGEDEVDFSLHKFTDIRKDDVGGKCRVCVDFSTDDGTFSISSDAYSPPVLIANTTPFCAHTTTTSSVLSSSNEHKQNASLLDNALRFDRSNDLPVGVTVTQSPNSSLLDETSCQRNPVTPEADFPKPDDLMSNDLPEIPTNSCRVIETESVPAIRQDSHSMPSTRCPIPLTVVVHPCASAPSTLDPPSPFHSKDLTADDNLSVYSSSSHRLSSSVSTYSGSPRLGSNRKLNSTGAKSEKMRLIDLIEFCREDPPLPHTHPVGCGVDNELHIDESVFPLSCGNTNTSSTQAVGSSNAVESRNEINSGFQMMCDPASDGGNAVTMRRKGLKRHGSANPFFASPSSSSSDLDMPLTSLESRFPSFFINAPSTNNQREELTPTPTISTTSLLTASSGDPTPSGTSTPETSTSLPDPETSFSSNHTHTKRSGSSLSRHYSSCVKSVTSALRRLPSPSQVIHRSSSLFASHTKCAYDLQLASMAYFSSCPSTPVTGKRRLTTTPSLLTFSPCSSSSPPLPHSQSLPPSPCTPFPNPTPPSTPSSLRLPLSPAPSPLSQSLASSSATTPISTASKSNRQLHDLNENTTDVLPNSSSLSSLHSLTPSLLTTTATLPPLHSSSPKSSHSSLTSSPAKKPASFWPSRPSASKSRKLRYRSLSLDGRISAHCQCGGDTMDSTMPWDHERPNDLCLSSFHSSTDPLRVHRPFIMTLYDAKKVERNRLSSPVDSVRREEKKAQQFGLSLTQIKENTGHIIPKPVEDTVEYLKSVEGDEVQGLFRRCARVTTMREVQEKYDDGETVDFSQYGDPHLAGAILKKFLRELSEPLMTFDLFEPITRLHYLEPGKQVYEVQRILKDELPEDNYIILKYIYQFLQQVVSKSEINLMTSANMATVFGPNIAWPKGQANLSNVEQAVKFSLILLDSFDDVFLR